MINYKRNAFFNIVLPNYKSIFNNHNLQRVGEIDMIRLPFDISLGLSKRKKAPVFYFFGKSFLPHQLLRLLTLIKQFKIICKNQESITIELYGQKLKLLHDFFFIFVDEWRTWEKYYLPPFPLYGKTVLDVGAGCGETAFSIFYMAPKKS